MTLQDMYEEGCRLYAAGRYADAEALFGGCLQQQPDNPDLLNAIGSAREALGSLDQAAADLEKACRLRPDSAPFHYNRANLLRKQGKMQLAEMEYLEAISTDSGMAEAYHGLGSLLLEAGRLEMAESSLQKAVEIAPGFVPALHDLGILHQIRGMCNEAERFFRTCVTQDSRFVPALNSLGMLLLRSNRVEEARSCFIEALRQKPDYLQARANLAVLATWCGELEFAVDELEKVLDYAPDDGDVHFNLSLALLASGRMAEGWKEHEWRFRKGQPVGRRHEDIPRWQGEPLDGKRILIHAEQGYGDSLQFIRYATPLAERGATVFVEAQDHIIAPLLATVSGVSRVLTRRNTAPPADYQIPMMSLPLPLGSSGWPPPALPYLFPSPQKIAAWQERLSGLAGLKVGLAWAGRPEHENDANRSIDENLLLPFGGLKGISYVSLQVGSGRPEKVPFELYDPSAQVTDFEDSAALVSALDLVITVDSAIAHLAGGLGIPVWVLLPWNPDWRWQHGRNDSDWYPSARLYRQAVPGDWNAVIGNVVIVLENLMHATNTCSLGNNERVAMDRLHSNQQNLDSGYMDGDGMLVWQRACQVVDSSPRDIDAWRSLVSIAMQGLMPAEQCTLPEEAFLAALQQDSSHFDELVAMWLFFIRQNSLYPRLFAAATNGSMVIDQLLCGVFDPILDDSVLRRICEQTIICDPDMERSLTALRRLFSGLVQRGPEVRKCLSGRYLPFLCSLAVLCFNNEYIFAVTDEEKSWQEHLIRLLERDSGLIEDEPGLLVLVGCYDALYRLPFVESLNGIGSLEHFSTISQVIRVQLHEPLAEKRLKKMIPKLTVINDDVSEKVRQQYEESPYPRWISISLTRPRPMEAVFEKIIPNLELGTGLDFESPEILVAGCGTGQHPIYTRFRFSGSRVTAVDLSLTSLAYAMRKCEEMGIQDIHFMQADILALVEFGRRFDVVECGGVLHHMADPLKGWRILLGLLKPSGIMGVGLYSRQSRKSINDARASIASKGYNATAEDMRTFRQEVLSTSDDPGMGFLRGQRDFYSMSGCRDMLFNVQEHQFDLREISEMLTILNLEFLGFQVSQAVMDRFRSCYPDGDIRSLESWHQFEECNPEVFSNMYQFYVRKAR